MLEFLYSNEDIRVRDPELVLTKIERGHEFDDVFNPMEELRANQFSFLYTGEDIRDREAIAEHDIPRGYEFEEMLSSADGMIANRFSFLYTGEDIRDFDATNTGVQRGHEFDDEFGDYLDDLYAYFDDDEDAKIFSEYTRYLRNLYRKQRQQQKEKDMQYSR